MNESENKSAGSLSEVNELREQCRDLQRQTGSLLLGAVVLSLVFTAYLGLNVKRAKTDLDGVRKVIAQNQNEQPAVQAFLGKLLEYGRTHPDFQPILTKYGIASNSTPASAVQPKTATPPAALKR